MATTEKVSFSSFCDAHFWCQVWRTLHQYFWRYCWLSVVKYCFSGTIYDVITFLICIIQKCKYLFNKKKIFQKGKHHSSLLWKTFQISNNYFLLHRHFKFHMFIQVKKFKLCCSRNYPYPSHKGILGWNPIPLEILVSVIILSSIKFF